MSETCHVVCKNDYPALVVIGSEEDAAKEAKKLEAELEKIYKYQPQYHHIYVHIKTVPLVRKEVE